MSGAVRKLPLFVAVLAMAATNNVWAADSFGFATWNVGHFALGNSDVSIIAPKDVAAKSAEYQKFIAEANVSVLGTCEHSAAFSSDGSVKAKDTAFAGFDGPAAGPVRGAHANAIYWKGAKLISSGHYEFPARSAECYCEWARLEIMGREVCFVETHCDWYAGAGHELDRLEQIIFLAKKFKDEPMVVIAGDFNTCVRNRVTGKWEDAAREFAAFWVAGFDGAHWGELLTWPSREPYLSIDNVFVKGFAISDVKVMADPTLSDHSLLRCTLTFTAENQVAWPADFDSNLELWRRRHQPAGTAARDGLWLDFSSVSKQSKLCDHGFDFCVATTAFSWAGDLKFCPQKGCLSIIR